MSILYTHSSGSVIQYFPIVEIKLNNIINKYKEIIPSIKNSQNSIVVFNINSITS